jgi:hypothetical protein
MRVWMVRRSRMGPPLGMHLLKQGHAVFVETPCPSSRRKQRNVSYLNLIPAPQANLNHLATLYIDRYSDPAVFQSICIVTVHPNNGWDGSDLAIHAFFPHKPAAPQAATTEASPLHVAMHKGCTRGVQGMLKGLMRHQYWTPTEHVRTSL